MDADGVLVNTSTGLRIQGWQAQTVSGSTGVIDTGLPIGQITIPVNSTLARATTNATLRGNLDSTLPLGNTFTDDQHQELGRKTALKKVEAFTYRPIDPTNPGELNNVDIDLENAKMAENQIQYNFNIEFSGFAKYQAAIKGQVY